MSNTIQIRNDLAKFPGYLSILTINKPFLLIFKYRYVVYLFLKGRFYKTFNATVPYKILIPDVDMIDFLET